MLASFVFNFNEGHLGVGFSEECADVSDNAADGDSFAVVFGVYDGIWMGLFFEESVVFVEWVGGEVETHEVAFPEKLFFFGEAGWSWFDFWFWDGAGIAERAKEISLAR